MNWMEFSYWFRLGWQLRRRTVLAPRELSSVGAKHTIEATVSKFNFKQATSTPSAVCHRGDKDF